MKPMRARDPIPFPGRRTGVDPAEHQRPLAENDQDDRSKPPARLYRLRKHKSLESSPEPSAAFGAFFCDPLPGRMGFRNSREPSSRLAQSRSKVMIDVL